MAESVKKSTSLGASACPMQVLWLVHKPLFFATGKESTLNPDLEQKYL
jgi:hypothetical protein